MRILFNAVAAIAVLLATVKVFFPAAGHVAGNSCR